MRAGRRSVVHRVEQERTARLQPFEHIVLIDVRRHVARYEIGRRDQIGRRDGQVAETQVRRGVTARFLRIVGEIGLAILVGRAADDLDRVFVGTHRAVGAQSEEERLERTGLGHRDLLAHGQRTIRHVVDDAHRELVLRFAGFQILEHGEHLRRRGVLRRETVTTADDERFALGGNLLARGERLDHVQIERIAVGSRLLGTIEHADALHSLGQHGAEVFHREGTVEVYGHHTHLPATGVQVVDRLFERLGHRTHRHDDMLGILRTVIDERLVVAARDRGDLAHRLGHHVGHGVVELVRGLARLEIDVGILGRTARHGVLGVERTGTELFQRVAVEHRRKARLVDQLDLLDLVRGAESVEEVEERHARFERHDVRHARQIHHLLHRRGSQHGETGLARGHHVLMVAEDRQRLRGQRTRRDVEHARQQLARNLVHIGNHQQQTLRCGERRGQRAALQRTVHGTRGTGLRLHFDDLDRLAEDVLATLGRPLVDQFRHGRRRRDGIDCSHLREQVGDVCRSVVSITGDKFFLCHINRLENC